MTNNVLSNFQEIKIETPVDKIIGQITALMPKINVNFVINDSTIARVTMEVLSEHGLVDVMDEIQQKLDYLGKVTLEK